MIKSRNRNIVIKSQFNIHGSRGKDAGKFVSDYVSRDSATDKSLAYRPNPNTIPVQGDGVAFTLDSTAISRKQTLDIANHVQELHAMGDRAIQQMVISFDHDYLVEQKIIPQDTEIIRKGDYRYNYDDVRLRHAVRKGLQSLIDNEGYRDGHAVGCIQWDTHHLHVHAVVYEDANKIARKRGKEEKGVIKQSSLNQMAHDVDRHLTLTKSKGRIPNEKSLTPKKTTGENQVKHLTIEAKEPIFVNHYLRIIQEQQRKQSLMKHKLIHQANEIVQQLNESSVKDNYDNHDTHDNIL